MFSFQKKEIKMIKSFLNEEKICEPSKINKIEDYKELPSDYCEYKSAVIKEKILAIKSNVAPLILSNSSPDEKLLINRIEYLLETLDKTQFNPIKYYTLLNNINVSLEITNFQTTQSSKLRRELVSLTTGIKKMKLIKSDFFVAICSEKKYLLILQDNSVIYSEQFSIKN